METSEYKSIVNVIIKEAKPQFRCHDDMYKDLKTCLAGCGSDLAYLHYCAHNQNYKIHKM